MADIKLYNGDCLEVMDKLIAEGVNVDAVITDPPYGTTACKWDGVINLYQMFQRLYKLRRNENTPIVLFGSQPFTSELITCNTVHFEGFKYEWIYQKIAGSNFATAKYQPIKEHENICVFGQKGHKVNYYPVMQNRSESGKKRLETPYHTNSETSNETMGNISRNNAGKEYDKQLRFPSSVQKFNNREKNSRGLHPTQKPLSLMEYLVKTYTKENETVLDFTMGSGTTGVACKHLNRNFIGIELDRNYFEIAKKRIESEQGGLF